MTLKMGSRSPKSNQHFSPSQWYICVSLAKICPTNKEIRVQTRGYVPFSNNLSPPVTLKMVGGHKNTLATTVNEFVINELVMLTMLWTIGPWYTEKQKAIWYLLKQVWQKLNGKQHRHWWDSSRGAIPSGSMVFAKTSYCGLWCWKS